MISHSALNPMTPHSALNPMTPKDRAKYGAALAKSAAFDAVFNLLRRRNAEGRTQIQIAEAIGADTGWLSKQFIGPRNWTMETFGALVEALDGEVEIVVRAMEDPLPSRPNYDAYLGYGMPNIIAASTKSVPPSTVTPASTKPLPDELLNVIRKTSGITAPSS